MNLFEIIGPVMVGPSSSHTAGAVRIGNIGRRLLGEEIKDARIFLYGSFLTTGKGHGTDRALIAGLLGLDVDDARIPQSFSLASHSGLSFKFDTAELKNAHPNSVKMIITGTSGKSLEFIAASIGGGRIEVEELDGVRAVFSGEHPTLIVHNLDQPGYVAEVTALLEHESVNIGTMQLYRAKRGGSAVMVLECDQEIPGDTINRLSSLNGVEKVTYLGAD